MYEGTRRPQVAEPATKTQGHKGSEGGGCQRVWLCYNGGLKDPVNPVHE